MRVTRTRLLVRLAVAFAIGAVCLLAFAPGHTKASASNVPHASASCPPEANSCVQMPFDASNPNVATICPTGCTLTAGPVSALGQGQSVYVDVSGLAAGEEVALAMCTLPTGTQPVAQPQCASYLPAGPSCTENCSGTPSPLEWQYDTAASADTVMSIGTQYDPDVSGQTPITSQTSTQYQSGDPNAFGSFFCDNGPANPCGIEVMDLGPSTQDVVGDGFPPRVAFNSTTANTVVIPLNWASTGTGCGSAPIMQVDSSYSAAQFLPAAGEATCNGPDGVAVLATSVPSVDDPTCASGTGSCPIGDVISGQTPASFTDDPNDPATLAELQAAGGKFAYIPVAVSATEIAFEGQAGQNGSGGAIYPLSNYDLTPAQTAGIMTQQWYSPIAGLGLPQDDICGQLTGTAACTETPTITNSTQTVYEVNGQSANVDVEGVDGGTPTQGTFPFLSYGGTYSNESFKNPLLNDEQLTGYSLLNPWPGDTGLSTESVTESNLEAMFPSTASGASYETSGWMCGAPDTPYSVTLPGGTTATVKDLESSQQLLADGEQDPIEMTQGEDGTWTLDPSVTENVQASPSGCEALSSLPTDLGVQTTAGGGISSYAPSSQPLTAAHAISGSTSKGLLGFAFTAMDSSEADFYGLLPANLQNASGAFVAPSAPAITAALNDATPAKNGTLIPSFTNTSDAAAYPMPMVTYALISTSPQPSTAQAAQLTEMLTNVVKYSNTAGAGTSEPLPPGYVPLPTNLYQQALSEIASDVIAPDGQPVGGEAAAATLVSGSGSDSGTSTTPDSSSEFSPDSFGGDLGAPFGLALGKTAGNSSAKGTSGSPSGGSVLNPIGRFIAVTLGDNRFLVPGLLLLALICLVAGPLLYMSPSIRKPATATDGGEAGTGDEGESPPPVE